MSYIMDGREVKIGDKLYDLVYGEVEVEQVYIGSIVCYSTVGGMNFFYNLRYAYRDDPFCINRVLYWSKPEFEIPKPPKQKVKKYKVLFKPVGYNDYLVTTYYYENKEEYENRQPWNKFIQLIEDSMIEVDE